MKERGIPYSADMVRARRAGLKTQTRRAVNAPAPSDATSAGVFWAPGKSHDGEWNWLSGDPRDAESWGWVGEAFRCPYGQIGDRLWTREAWRTLAQHDALPPRDVPVTAPIWYEVDGPAPDGFGRYRHARFMCRWMSRGLDDVVDIRVERLQEISEADAIAEGITTIWPDGPRDDGGPNHYTVDVGPGHLNGPTAATVYRMLWELINGEGSWDANPWVWVVEFKRVTP